MNITAPHPHAETQPDAAAAALADALPDACYRLQFRNGVDFDRAASLVPYLRDLGISHLYASPLFQAAEGSTHGYDVTDPGVIDPVLGGRAGLDRLAEALHRHDMGLVLDIVPNHMAFSIETPWLRDVLRHGRESRYAPHFDFDLTRHRLRLPWLEAPFEMMLADDAISVDADADGPVMVAGSVRVPLAGGSDIDAAGPDALRDLHEAQPWRLTHWRTEADAITHRRFFNVTSLVGVRVEDDAVFQDVHRLLFDLVDADIVQGIRIDHVDGLADPAGYLAKMRDRLPATPIWIEKILTEGEALPDWPVQGETGYAAAQAFARVLTEPDGTREMLRSYRFATGRTRRFANVVKRAKRQIVTEDLAAELWALHDMLRRFAEGDPVGSEIGPEALRTAIVEFIASFPRYRTYMTEGPVAPEDAALVAAVVEDAAATLRAPGALPFLGDVLVRDDPAAAAFRIRFQQVTGAAIAKAQEDTAFYRETRLLSANEVGAEPADATMTVPEFHHEMAKRIAEMPHGLTLTSSHDTKRSEDARMRIAAITHAPDAFAPFHAECAAMAGPDVEPNLVWYLSQSLLAIHGSGGDMTARMVEHVEKAMREAKRTTFWADPDEAVEGAARDYTRALVERFDRLPDYLGPILRVAERLTLLQRALHLTAPGIPDLYQGCEIASYRLTDPDNRAPVDFDRLAGALTDASALSSDLDRHKFALTRALLSLRGSQRALFLRGTYEGRPSDPRVISFTRAHGGTAIHVDMTATADDATSLPPAQGETIWPSAAWNAASPIRVSLREA